MAVSVIAASGCTGADSADDGIQGDCAEIDETAVRLDLDGDAILPVAQLSTLATADANATDSVFISIAHNEPAPPDLALGEEIVVDVALNGLIVGESALSAPDASLNYRRYPASDTPRAPSETEASTAITGTIDVIAIAAEIGETTCGTFVIRAQGARDVEAAGWFKQRLEAPQPGS